jgi:hypothetical protein
VWWQVRFGFSHITTIPVSETRNCALFRQFYNLRKRKHIACQPPKHFLAFFHHKLPKSPMAERERPLGDAPGLIYLAGAIGGTFNATARVQALVRGRPIFARTKK